LTFCKTVSIQPRKNYDWRIKASFLQTRFVPGGPSSKLTSGSNNMPLSLLIHTARLYDVCLWALVQRLDELPRICSGEDVCRLVR